MAVMVLRLVMLKSAFDESGAGLDHEPFEIPNVYAGWDAKTKGATKAEKEWNAKFAAYKSAYPELARNLSAA